MVEHYITNQDKPRCVECGADDVSIDDEGLCNVCFVVRGLRAMAQQLDNEREIAKRN
jgi:hypothetical protein